MAVVKLKYIYCFLAFVLVFISCQKNNDDHTLTVQLEPFTEVEINDSFVVYLSEGEDYQVTVQGKKKAVEVIEVRVENGVLVISNERKMKWTTPRKNEVEIYITAPPLELMTLKETCNLRSLTPITSEEFGLVLLSKANEATIELDVTTFYYWNNFPCGGKLTLSGRTDNLKIWNFAILSVDAKELVTNYAWVANASNGDCEVQVTEKLEYSINGAGDIHLFGAPPEINLLGSEGPGILIEHE